MDDDRGCDFCNYEDFKSQIIFEDDMYRVIYPRRPVFDYHLMIVPVKHRRTFDELDTELAASVPQLVRTMVESFKEDDFLGYNIFSNNGDESIGQTVPHFHLHMFIRYRDEEVSPYTLMNQSERKQLSKEQWSENFEIFKSKLSR